MTPCDFRKRQRLTIDEMAAWCGVSSTTYHRWESGEVKKITPAYLFNEIEAKARSIYGGMIQTDIEDFTGAPKAKD